MFHFIFKMFSEGSACLPEGGMSAVGEQLRADLENFITGMDVLTGTSVEGFKAADSEGDSQPPSYLVEAKAADGSQSNVMAKKVVVATGARKAYELAGTDPALLPPQRRVGCVYYGLSSEVRVVQRRMNTFPTSVSNYSIVL
jgi:phytoene dehydrogenase-like protein